MACLRGRATPTAQTKLRLFSDSAGHCNRPECRKPLFSEEGQGDYNIGELAHILAAQDGGPRPEPELAQEHRASYSNLILLCPTCHTMIDKCPDEFPDTLLRDWKLRHKARITEAIGVPSVSTRDAARQFLEPILRANRSIHEQYGPDNDYRENPEAEEASIWKHKVIGQIIPNSKKIILFVDKNIELLHDTERDIVELFRQHFDDLVERHLGGTEAVSSRFPPEMDSLFTGS